MFRLIAISGQSGTGKSLLSRLLSQKLNWPIFSVSNLQRENVKKFNLGINDVDQLPDSVHQDVDRQMEEMVKNGKNMILESRLVGWQSRNYPDVLRILCFNNQDSRVQRYIQRESIDYDQAKKELNKRDQKNRRKFKELYQIENYDNKEIFHLILETDKMTPEEEVQKVIDYIQAYSHA